MGKRSRLSRFCEKNLHELCRGRFLYDAGDFVVELSCACGCHSPTLEFYEIREKND